ncbi:ABC transporter permease [Ethanoligenens sp.]|uniref:ABC transporter permease n=1 Tax=Ethanoligenens sp. TaxID=2099655 RepID=UPI0039ED6CC5
MCDFIIDLLLNAVRNLGRKKLRTGMMVLGIAIGVSSVILIASIGESGQNAITSQLNNIGMNGLNIQSANPALSQSTLTDSDLHKSRQVKGVKNAMPIIMQMGGAQLRNLQKQVLIWGIGEQARQMQTVHLLHGTMLTNADIQNNANVCLVEDAYARAAYKRSNIVGKTITIFVNNTSTPLTIKGVVANGSGMFYNLVGSYIPGFVYVPYTTAEVLRGADGYDQIAVQTNSNTNNDAIGNRIISALSTDNSGNTYVAMNMFKQRQQLLSVLGIITLIISAVGGISLIVAGLGIMTVMTVSVSERTKEIGIKKAIGAPRGAILLEFLFEALGISMLGGAAGLAAGLSLAYIAMLIMHIPFAWTIQSVLISTQLSIAIGVIFGVYPAMKAARLNPVEALRCE